MSNWDIEAKNASGVLTWYDFETLGSIPAYWSGEGIGSIGLGCLLLSQDFYS